MLNLQKEETRWCNKHLELTEKKLFILIESNLWDRIVESEVHFGCLKQKK